MQILRAGPLPTLRTVMTPFEDGHASTGMRSCRSALRAVRSAARAVCKENSEMPTVTAAETALTIAITSVGFIVVLPGRQAQTALSHRHPQSRLAPHLCIGPSQERALPQLGGRNTWRQAGTGVSDEA